MQLGGADGHLDNIQVDTTHRRKGIGSKLLRRFIQETGEIDADIKPQGMSNSELEKFCKKNGYTVENGKVRRL